jgi:hypothetical protein
MRSRRNIRFTALALGVVMALATGGWLAARQVRSPAQIAADTAPPRASMISVPVERRALATEVIVRGTVRYGAPQIVSLPASGLKTGASVVSRVPLPGARLAEPSVPLVVSGRPVFLLRGATPMYRDIGPGSEGRDVLELEEALLRAGLDPGAVDGRYDSATAGAVTALYKRSGETPFGVTDAQAERLNTLAGAASTARDAALQMRLALRTAQHGTRAVDVNQARLDAAAATESVPATRLAIATAEDKAAAARDALATALRLQAGAQPLARRDVTAAEADVVNKQIAITEAVDHQADAQRQLDGAPPDSTAAEIDALRTALRQATARVLGARADLLAAQGALDTARFAPLDAIATAGDDGRRALRELRVAGAELRQARATLVALERKRRLAEARVRILIAPPDTGVERRMVASTAAEARRTREELARVASRSGVQVPADEILFVPTTPVRVDTVTAKPGSAVVGDIMTVTNSTLAIDSSLSVTDAKLVRRGMRVRVEEPDLRIALAGRVSQVAPRPGTNNVDPTRTYFEVDPGSAPSALIGASVKLSIAVRSTSRKVLAVPVSALSVDAAGDSRVQLDLGRGRTRFVAVLPGLAAQGFVEVRAKRKGALRSGDRVVVGSGRTVATRAPTGVPTDPVPPGSGSSASGGSGSGAPAPTTASPTPAASAAPTPSDATPSAPATPGIPNGR